MIVKIKKKIRWTIRVLNKKINENYPAFIHIYNQRKHVENTHRSLEKLNLLAKSLYDAYVKRKTILFYPDKPLPLHALYKVLMFLGFRITTNPSANWDIAMKWFNAYDGNPFLPTKENILKNVAVHSSNSKFLNLSCEDISKNYINKVFYEVFEYQISVDPTKFNGQCVAKSNWNALHEGRVIQCPIKEREPNVTYQRLIYNEVSEDSVEDIRVPVFGGIIPFVYLKYRPIESRFVDRKHTNTKANIAEVAEVLSKEELTKLNRFCKRLGLDYCEIDVLRDRHDGKIYIVDVNNTPSGPTSSLNDNKSKTAVFRLSQAFEKAFSW